MEDWISTNNSLDIWRHQNPDTRAYTWHSNPRTKKSKTRKNLDPDHDQESELIFCRLDFFLINQNWVQRVLATKILPGYHSDHSLVLQNLDINTPRKGRGFWKLNTSLLSDPNYVSRIQNSIVQTKEDNIGADPDLLWDIIKCNIRRDTISYTFHKKKLTPHNLDLLENNLEKLTQQQMDGTGIPNIEQQIEQCKKQIDDIITLETQGSTLRAKTQYYEDGEKGSKYFHDLENRNYTNKTIYRLQTTTGIITSDTQDILAEGETFFSQLYESKIDKTLEDNSENWDKFFPNKSVSNDKELINKLDTLELPLTESELWKAIRESSINKKTRFRRFPNRILRYLLEGCQG